MSATNLSMQAAAEAAIQRISEHETVEGLIILSADGTPARSSFDSGLTAKYANHFSVFTTMANTAVRDIDPTNRLSYVRMLTNTREIIAVTGDTYTVLVVVSEKK